jgi:DNA-binding NarL/FixJ family response regulator
VAYPDLTPGYLKLADNLRMNLSSKEIAPLLHISIRGVENKRYRLRKKMGLDADANLTILNVFAFGAVLSRVFMLLYERSDGAA